MKKKPVVVVQFTASEGPGYLAEFLSCHDIPYQVVRIDLGDALPATMDDCSGMAMMGGPMSVNDTLPWIPHLLTLVRQAVQSRVPVIGHCLGGQMLAKAMGGGVTDHDHAEIGWVDGYPLDVPQALEWLGSQSRIELFQWHYQTFSIPPGATHILRSDYCANQAYVLDGLHIGFQCHIEMQASMVREWCELSPDELKGGSQADPLQPVVQSATEILHELDMHIFGLNRLAEHVYGRWIKGLRQG